MKFSGGFFGKLLRFLLCVLLGVVLTLGGIVGAGYYALMTGGMMGKIEDIGHQNGFNEITFTDEVRDMSVYEWGMQLVQLASTLTSDNGTTIGELEDFIGTSLISNALCDVLKLDDASVIKAASLTGSETGLAAVIVNTMTMKNIVKMVGEENNFLPDLPLFKDDSEFMDKPLKEAFSNLTDYTIGDFIEVKEDSASVIKAVAPIKIKEISEKLPTLPIGDFIDQGENTHPVVKAIADLSINDLGTEKLTQAINKMKLSDVLTGMTEDDTNKVLYSLKDTTVGELSGTEADKLVKSMFLAEIMDIDPTSNLTLQSLQYACIASQYVTLTSPSFSLDGKYAYVPGSDLDLLLQNTNGSCYVKYYPEKTVYDCVRDNSNVIAMQNGGYPIDYRIYRPTSTLTNNSVTVNGVTFTAVLGEDEQPVTSGENTLVHATLYVNQKDATFAEEAGTATVKNRYHALYDENGNLKFFNGFDDATIKGALYLPTQCVDSVDVDERIVSSIAEHKISGTNYLDRKALKSRDTIAVSEQTVPVYEYHPLEGINEKMNDLTLDGVIEINESSPLLLRSMRSTKITEMGTKIDTMTLGEMVDAGSSKLLQSLSDTTLNGLGNKVNTLFIDEIITLDSNSSQMIRSLRYATLDSQIEYIDISTLQHSDLLATTDAAVYHALEAEYYGQFEKADGTVVNRYYYKVTGGAVDETYVLYFDENDDVRTQGGNTAFYKVRKYEQRTYSYVNLSALTLPTDVNPAVGDNLTILNAREADKTYYYAVDGTGAITNEYIVSMKDGAPELNPADTTQTRVYTVTDKYNRPMVGLSDKTSELTLGDVFSAETLEKGVLGLIDGKTKLNNISSEVAKAVQNSSVAILADTGVISQSTFTGGDFASLTKERKSFIYNSNMTDMLNGLIGFVAHPLDTSAMIPTIDYSKVSPKHVSIAETTFDTLTQFVAAYSQYDELEFTGGAVTVTVNTADGSDDNRLWGRDINNDNVIDYYAIPMFSLIGTNGITFEDTSSAPVGVYIAVYNVKSEKSAIAATYSSLCDFADAYAQYDTLTLTGNVTVTVDTTAGSDDMIVWGVDTDSDNIIDCFNIPTYSIEGSFSITFEDAGHNPVTVNLVCFDDMPNKYTTYHQHQVGYYYDSTGTSSISPEVGNAKIERIS